MSLNIPPEFERAVLERVQSGQYGSTDAVLEACLQALDAAEDDYEAKRERLLHDLDEAIAEVDRGEVIDGELAFAEARAEFRRRTGR